MKQKCGTLNWGSNLLCDTTTKLPTVSWESDKSVGGSYQVIPSFYLPTASLCRLVGAWNKNAGCWIKVLKCCVMLPHSCPQLSDSVTKVWEANIKLFQAFIFPPQICTDLLGHETKMWEVKSRFYNIVWYHLKVVHSSVRASVTKVWEANIKLFQAFIFPPQACADLLGHETRMRDVESRF